MMMRPIDEDAEVLSLSSSASARSTCDQVKGVIFGRSVRSSYACLHMARLLEQDDDGDDEGTEDKQDDDDKAEAVLIRLQFIDNPRELRSYCRRFCKLGDLMSLSSGEWKDIDPSIETQWQSPRLVIDLFSVQQAETALRVNASRFWGIKQIQAWQEQYLNISPMKGKVDGVSTDSTAVSKPPSWIDQPSCPNGESSCTHHSAGGLAKRQQGEYIANFLIHMIASKLQQDNDGSFVKDPCQWATADIQELDSDLRQSVIDKLNAGTGVIDAAGGSGHVSMALGMRGIRSTVVDPRENVGKLPGRDRKIWYRALKQKDQVPTNSLYCQPVQYDTVRAWFGIPPEFRHENQAELPVCASNHQLISHCTAVVALHPDEATDAIVDTAIEQGVPFIIVPCCVFFRLFPHRRKPGSREPVSTHPDLLEYLMAKDKSIRSAELPFIGANTILWSTF